MDRTRLVSSLAVLAGAVFARRGEDGDADVRPIAPLPTPAAAWRDRLDASAWRVLFARGTERPCSSPLLGEHRPGTFVCAACHLPLFDARAKVDSAGWPSFTAPLAGRVATRRDFTLIVPRTTYHCVRCGGHQGRVVRDGRPPTGHRYCNNGVALRFVPVGSPLPALRG